MSKRKGMSADDKRRVILKIYHDRKEPFNLKEIETIASKQGVVQQTIKDMNQSLIDDFLVLSDKIGSANFFWSFPSKVTQDKKNEEEMMSNQLARCNATIAELRCNLVDENKFRCADERCVKLAHYEELLRQEKEYDTVLLASKANDPKEVNRVLKIAAQNMEHANRWTDNTWTVKKFLTSKKGMSGKEADKMLKIDDAFDYVTEADLIKSSKGKKK